MERGGLAIRSPILLCCPIKSLYPLEGLGVGLSIHVHELIIKRRSLHNWLVDFLSLDQAVICLVGGSISLLMTCMNDLIITLIDKLRAAREPTSRDDMVMVESFDLE